MREKCLGLKRLSLRLGWMFESCGRKKSTSKNFRRSESVESPREFASRLSTSRLPTTSYLCRPCVKAGRSPSGPMSQRSMRNVCRCELSNRLMKSLSRD